MALTDKNAAQGDQGGSAEIEFLGPEKGGDDDIQTGADTAVGTESDAVAKSVKEKNLLSLGHAEFPGTACIFDGGKGGGSGPAVVSGDEDHIGMGFGDSRGNGADSSFGYKFDADLGPGINLFEVVNQLGEILNAVDVVMGRGRNQHDAGGGAAEGGNQGRDLVARELTAFAGLGSLGNLDFQFRGAGQILGGHTKPAGSDLFDPAVF